MDAAPGHDNNHAIPGNLKEREMKLGLFLMPSHPPKRGLKAGQEFDLEMLRVADRLGYSEAWVGEHFTAPWEPNPAPDLLIAQALMQTKNINDAYIACVNARIPFELALHIAPQL
jgi:alkanesulfonate monooxygenase SsuD/methylene tetrahydromethanopterin reductase-like flavin-dependent oxidoreductase (luciferase family)